MSVKHIVKAKHTYYVRAEQRVLEALTFVCNSDITNQSERRAGNMNVGVYFVEIGECIIYVCMLLIVCY
jgi:hypothetical protein